MEPDLKLWRDAKRVFDRLVHVPPERRAERLGRTRLSDDVRVLVQRLFDAQERRAGLLDTPLAGGAAGSLKGRALGDWVLEHELGRGGSAVVYRARSADATGRVAAVKLVTLGSLARAGLDRFWQEQRILARLNHPHIAQLFDVGRADDGTPWLAMALVDGAPIDAWCADRQLPARAVVRLFLDVCAAVAYAHRSLVIHRDIKPSNVLVDEHGHVRLLDFGIARLLDDETAATETQWRALTPQYAAPEQFSGAPASTAMDVFGLGALLYRLLCGRVPRAGGALTGELPTAPSRALLADRAGTAVALRDVRGDLDAVVLKALANRPEDRYASVPEFAADLRRWLDGEPVSATRPSLPYRVRKFVARHRLAVFATFALFLTLLGGIVATTWQAQRARQETARAQAVKRFITSLLGDAGPGAYAGTVTDIREALARGADRARTELKDTPQLEAELLLLIGTLQGRFSQYVPARPQLEDALALTQARTSPQMQTLHGRVLVELGLNDLQQRKLTESMPRFDTAIAELTGAPDNESREALMSAYIYRSAANQFLGHLDAAYADLDVAERIEPTLEPRQPRRRMEVLSNRGRVLSASGRYAEALAAFVAARDLLPDNLPADYILFDNIGNATEALGDWKEAEVNYRRALELVRAGYPAGNQVIAGPLSYLGIFLRRSGRLEEAEKILTEAYEVRRANSPPGSPLLAVSSNNLGAVLRDRGFYDAALVHLRRASALSDVAYGAAHPRSALTMSEATLALAEAGRRAEAEFAIGSTAMRIAGAQAAGIANPSMYAHAYTWLAHAAHMAGEPLQELHFALAAQEAESREVPAGDPAVVGRAALHIEALLDSGQEYVAGVLGEQLERRLGRMGADQPSFERARALAILARAALVRGDFGAARRLAAAALQRGAQVSYPEFVEADLATLARDFGLRR